MSYKVICKDRNVSAKTFFTHNRNDAEFLAKLLSRSLDTPFVVYEYSDTDDTWKPFSP